MMSDDEEIGNGWVVPVVAGIAALGLIWLGTSDPEPTPARRKTRGRKRKPRRIGRCRCKRYAPLFREYASPLGIPVAYMQALACRESTCNPLDREGAAWGLMQVTEVVRLDEPREDGKPGRYEREELFDPRISVFLCTRVLAKTIRVLNMVGIKTDWQDSVWIGLVTAGWNAGYSLKSGVGLVVRYLKARGWNVRDIDNKVIHENAKKAGASFWLWGEPGRLEWWETVVRMYFKISREQGSMR